MFNARHHLLHTGLTSVQGPLVFVRNVSDVGLYDRVEVLTSGGARRIGRVVSIAGENVVVEVFQGTDGLSLERTRLRFLAEPVRLGVGPGMLGRIYNGIGEPADGGPPPSAVKRLRVDGQAINPVRREVPREFIETGISAIDAMNVLVRGQKLPIFSGSGLSHDQLAANVARFARLRGEQAEEFAIVFAAIGVTYDTAEHFRQEMDEYGALERIALFLNLASDPSAERLLTPRIALTAAEYLAYEEGRHVLVRPCARCRPVMARCRAARAIPATCTPTWQPSMNARAVSVSALARSPRCRYSPCRTTISRIRSPTCRVTSPRARSYSTATSNGAGYFHRSPCCRACHA